MSILATIQHELEFNMPEGRANELAKVIFTAILPEIREYEPEAAEDALNTLLRMKAYRRDQGYRYALDLDGSDIAFVVTMAGVLWPLGWLTSFTAYPALWTHKRRKRVPHDWSRLNEWADRKLNKEDS